MAKLFFLLSGENETLPAAELKAILEAEGFAFEVKEQLDQVVRLDAAKDSVKAVHRRSAYTRTCVLELFACEAEETAIMKSAESVDFRSVLGEGESFAVRVRRVKEYAGKIGTVPLEGKLGKHVLHSTTKTRVNLRKPDKTFFGVLTSGKLVFGLRLAEMEIKTFSERRPRKKPFFHPSAMPSKLARCMVNLARARSGELVLDPFCGTGSALIEAAFVGCRVLGFDVQRRMAEGTRRNLRYFGVDAEGLVIADSRKLPLIRIDHVVTDPPYGKSATTMKSTTKQLVEGVLSSAWPLLSVGQLICIASPKTLNISRVGAESGYKHLESHFTYVHRTLTREIAVFEKT
ncbi:RsmD family RNA methyltransferase [Candidatus Bathyarchaeota archaeon]|nr:RsmD family RNA methyltransferase [Candidatus Bathyarchaeota archaeon]